jgi:hypothetical protein
VRSGKRRSVRVKIGEVGKIAKREARAKAKVNYRDHVERLMADIAASTTPVSRCFPWRTSCSPWRIKIQLIRDPPVSLPQRGLVLTTATTRGHPVRAASALAAKTIPSRPRVSEPRFVSSRPFAFLLNSLASFRLPQQFQRAVLPRLGDSQSLVAA